MKKAVDIREGDRLRLVDDTDLSGGFGATGTALTGTDANGMIQFASDFMGPGRVAGGEYCSWRFRILERDGRPYPPEDTPEAGSGHPEDSQTGSKGPSLAHGDRLKEYGPPHVSFSRIAEFWTIYLEGVAREQGYDPNQVPDIQPEDVAAMMILLKVSRKITDHKADTLDDIDGYTETIRMLRSTDQED